MQCAIASIQLHERRPLAASTLGIFAQPLFFSAQPTANSFIGLLQGGSPILGSAPVHKEVSMRSKPYVAVVVLLALTCPEVPAGEPASVDPAHRYLQYDRDRDIESRCFADIVLEWRMATFFNDVQPRPCRGLGDSWSAHIEIKNAAEEQDALNAASESPAYEVIFCAKQIDQLPQCFGQIYL